MPLFSAINDALIYIDNEGAVQPALATSWRRVSPQEMEFELRRGVRFHNGDLFDADDVVATFDAHRLPTASATKRGILGVVTHATRVDDYTVRIHTAMPDAMLLRRQKSVRELVGPLEDSCMQQASRREKRVRFELQGGDVRWPTQLEGIFEVLPHMIRNSIDHGIEPPDKRFGKDEVATIRLSVSAQENRLTLSLRDDGRGIALERVEQRALSDH